MTRKLYGQDYENPTTHGLEVRCEEKRVERLEPALDNVDLAWIYP